MYLYVVTYFKNIIVYRNTYRAGRVLSYIETLTELECTSTYIETLIELVMSLKRLLAPVFGSLELFSILRANGCVSDIPT